MAQDWSRQEVEALVADYLDMLLRERREETVNKAEHNRNLRNVLTRRNKGSVEFKHQNVSAVLQELGYPWIEGYKPRSNYQDLLFEVVQERLAEFPTLDDVIAAQVTALVHPPIVPADLLSILVTPPKVDSSARPMYERAKRASPRVAVRRNWLEIEARNQSLGRAGEALVVEFEKERLWKAGQKKLSERVELISVTKGDGLGYDVQSFEETGQERFIEVKTTQFGVMTPFFASRAEVDVSVEREGQYQLYRLYHFNKGPKLFTLPGSLRESCRLQPVTFAATPG